MSAGAILPAGCQIRLDTQSGRQQARLAPNSEADALDGLDDDYAADAGQSAEPFDAEAMDLRALEGQEPPDREWTWDGWVPHGRACYLTGYGGVGKTLVSQMLGTAAALGRTCSASPRAKHRLSAFGARTTMTKSGVGRSQ